MSLRVGSLFSGIGGIDLGLERAGMRTRWFSEIDPYACRVLRKHWPEVPNHGDITQIDFTAVEPVDVLAGGFPCQDISNAGKRAGIEGERSGLWGEYVRAIRELRPGYVFVENVAALLYRGIERVVGDLASLGYDAEWSIVSGCSVGTPHRRQRVFILAYPAGRRLERGGKPHAHNRPSFGDWRSKPTRSDSGGRTGYGRWAPEPDVGRVAHGIPSRVDRLRGLGNAVVPQVPELIGGWIIEHARATGYLEAA